MFCENEYEDSSFFIEEFTKVTGSKKGRIQKKGWLHMLTSVIWVLKEQIKYKQKPQQPQMWKTWKWAWINQTCLSSKVSKTFQTFKKFYTIKICPYFQKKNHSGSSSGCLLSLVPLLICCPIFWKDILSKKYYVLNFITFKSNKYAALLFHGGNSQ